MSAARKPEVDKGQVFDVDRRPADNRCHGGDGFNLLTGQVADEIEGVNAQPAQVASPGKLLLKSPIRVIDATLDAGLIIDLYRLDGVEPADAAIGNDPVRVLYDGANTVGECQH